MKLLSILIIFPPSILSVTEVILIIKNRKSDNFLQQLRMKEDLVRIIYSQRLCWVTHHKDKCYQTFLVTNAQRLLLTLIRLLIRVCKNLKLILVVIWGYSNVIFSSS